jgi:outer membrane protein
MKKLVFVVAILGLLTGRLAYAEDIKIGVVDLIKALNESESGKKAKTELEGLIKSKQATLDEKSKNIEKMKGELEKQASILSAEARKAKEDELERMIREYQRMVADSQGEVKKKENDYTAGIVKELRVIIEKIGKDEGYTVILEKAEGIVLFSKENLDITDTVIKKYNESKVKPEK